MFKDEYKKAYDNVKPDSNCIDAIEMKMVKKSVHIGSFKRVKPAIATFVILFMVAMISAPVFAKDIPIAYRLASFYAPDLVNYIVPDVQSISSEGIVMKVEAINVNNNLADIIVSFSDEPGYDYIKGKVDMYDSYDLYSYSAMTKVGGCTFLNYDKKTDKAYFQIHVESDNKFNKEKLSFEVKRLMVDFSREEKDLSLANIDYKPCLKVVKWNGFSDPSSSMDKMPNEGSVLKVDYSGENLASTLSVTGMAYSDGIFRLQTCRGDLSNSDRHLEPTLLMEDGKEVSLKYSAGWHENVNGQDLSFEEFFYEISKDELSKCKLNGIFDTRENPVSGNWKVVFSVE